MYYALGRLGRTHFINKWGYYIGITPERIEAVERRFNKHPGRMIIFGKLAYGFEIVAVIAAGITRVPFFRFVGYAFISAVPKFTAFALIGYFFGSTYITVAKSLKNLALAVPVVLVIAIVVFFGYRFITKEFTKKL